MEIISVVLCACLAPILTFASTISRNPSPRLNPNVCYFSEIELNYLVQIFSQLNVHTATKNYCLLELEQESFYPLGKYSAFGVDIRRQDNFTDKIIIIIDRKSTNAFPHQRHRNENMMTIHCYTKFTIL